MGSNSVSLSKEKCTMNDEIWKPVVGYEGLYEVSNYGNVKSLGIRKKGKLLSLKIAPKARYVTVKLYHNGGQDKRMWMVHRLVWHAFVGDITEGFEINHIDTNKSNNRLENLECITHLENMRHAFAMGLFAERNLGEKHPMVKLTELQVIEIRAICEENPDIDRAELAGVYGINKHHLNKIVSRKVWKHVK